MSAPFSTTGSTTPASPVVFTPTTRTAENQSAPQTIELPPLDRCDVWDVPFDRVTMAGAVDRIEQLVARGRPSYVITANLNYVMLHHEQADVPEITRDADLILADGQPIVWRSQLGPDPLPQRVAGSEMIHKLACRAGQKQWGVYFLGGASGVAEACAKRLARDYPGMRIAGIESPPFRALSEAEQAEQDQRIRQSGAQILLVAFGQPKGERWIYENYQRLGIPVSIQLGASFDFIAGTAKRAPKIWQRMGAEWAYRMLSDPRRLVPRYGKNAVYLMRALIDDWKQTVRRWGMSPMD
ncbi:WecB/TagA/CpsF family glycosyltransferase [Rhodopirellula sp. JC639]|uniref:WecB/TagA/CpsF family glycosyltransferase n=1 Tax=Stieleria mannarensis TaxID=2755585 RepID=UPI0016011E53|nr:WecB/TagA/CpsF family glycosyltransferase [Rhodopirellula sp. JC639]